MRANTDDQVLAWARQSICRREIDGNQDDVEKNQAYEDYINAVGTGVCYGSVCYPAFSGWLGRMRPVRSFVRPDSAICTSLCPVVSSDSKLPLNWFWVD